MFSNKPVCIAEDGTHILSFSKDDSSKWNLRATSIEDLRLGLDYLIFCIKGNTDIRDASLELSKIMWSVNVEEIQNYIDSQLSGLVDKSVMPALLAEMRQDLEGSTGDIIPMMFRYIPKPNQLENIFRNIDIAPDKSEKWAADYVRERPTKPDGATLNFNDYIKIRGNQEIDQFNLALKALSLRNTERPISIIVETPINQYDAFNKLMSKPIANLANMIAGTAIDPILYKRFDFSINQYQELDIKVHLRDIDDHAIFSHVIGFAVGMMELLLHAAMIDIGSISLVFKNKLSDPDWFQYFLREVDTQGYNIVLNKDNLINIYKVDSLQHFSIYENNNEQT